MNLTKESEKFLTSLNDPQLVKELISDRIDPEVLKAIESYSKQIDSFRSKRDWSEEDITICSLLLGYLLKTHVDRIKLNCLI